jgi:hypothetical protein
LDINAYYWRKQPLEGRNGGEEAVEARDGGTADGTCEDRPVAPGEDEGDGSHGGENEKIRSWDTGQRVHKYERYVTK